VSQTDSPARPPSDLAVRAAAGVAMVAVAVTAIYLGGIVFWGLAVIGAIFMMGEWCDLHQVPPRTKRTVQLALSVPLAIMAPASLILQVHDFFSLGLLAGAAFFIIIVTQRRDLGLGVLYCGLPVLALVIIRRQHEGVVFALWALALVWMCDIGAYFAGRAIGGPKLAPRVSPNKTWAGLIGGMVMASAFAAFMHFYFGLPLRMTLATPVLAVTAQGGDLYESWLKRRAGVKDSGAILPGHGGIMDRLDGLVPVAPIAALLVVLPHFYR
jgi:CDP-diglyceride synthetase